MALDYDRIATALSSSAHPVSEIQPVVERYLSQRNYENEYQDCVALESFRKTLAELPAEERRQRAVAFASCWDGLQLPVPLM